MECLNFDNKEKIFKHPYNDPLWMNNECETFNK